MTHLQYSFWLYLCVGFGWTLAEYYHNRGHINVNPKTPFIWRVLAHVFASAFCVVFWLVLVIIRFLNWEPKPEPKMKSLNIGGRKVQ